MKVESHPFGTARECGIVIEDGRVRTFNCHGRQFLVEIARRDIRIDELEKLVRDMVRDYDRRLATRRGRFLLGLLRRVT